MGSKSPSSSVVQISDCSDSARMYAAVSFAVMLLVIGIPLWWKTTEVYRAPLPYSQIAALDPSSLKSLVPILISCRYPTLYNKLSRDLNSYFKDNALFNFEIKPNQLEFVPTLENAETYFSLHPVPSGHLLIIELSSLSNNQSILISNKRIIYITNDVYSPLLSEIILEWMLDGNAVAAKRDSLVTPDTADSNMESLHRLKASLGYDAVFTVINSDPYSINIVMDIKSAINNYVKPLLDQIWLVGQHTAKSQKLYLIELSQLITKVKGDHMIRYADLTHIITPLEKRLGSAVSTVPVLHFVLYMTKCSESPLWFESENGIKTTWMISPSWGGVQILNPDERVCNTSVEGPQDLVVDTKSVMAMFISQFHSLLGFSNHVNVNGVGFMKRRGPLLTDWQLDSLYRIRCMEQITSASLTLQSLAKLLGEISNIVIEKNVADSVSTATSSVISATAHLQSANLVSALRYSAVAFHEAETAFSDSSLLALLYFPDDQKYAVYIPLFLPIMIPVLMSLKPIYKWIRTGKVN